MTGRNAEELAGDLRSPTRRRAALQYLASSNAVDELRSTLLGELVRLIAYRHSDYDAALVAIQLVPRSFLDSNLWVEMATYLDGSDSEPFLHFTQFLDHVGRTSELERIVELARTFSDYDIREVADDFGSREA